MRAGHVRAAILTAVLGCSAGAAIASPGDGLANSAHDFTRASRTGSTGLCSSCHVPKTQGATRPAWDPAAPEDLLADPALAPARAAIVAALKADTLKGPSVRCVSCHDGTVAPPDTGAFRHTFAGSAGSAVASRTGQGPRYGLTAGEHPVPMPYPFRNVASTYDGVRTEGSLMTAEWVADPTAGNIRLYSDDGSGAIVPTPRPGKTGIECSSCHDPHNKQTKEKYLLRAVLGGASRAAGYLCLQCHDQQQPR